MTRSFLFVSRNFLTMHWVFLGYGVLISAYMGMGNSTDSVLGNYYLMFPLMPAICLFLYGTNNGNYLNVALSMGCRRRDYLAGSQAALAVNALVFTGLTALFLYLPDWLGWTWVQPFMSVRQLPLVLLVSAAAGELSSAIGLLFRTHGKLAVAACTAAICLQTASLVILILDDYLNWAIMDRLYWAAAAGNGILIVLGLAASVRWTLQTVVR